MKNPFQPIIEIDGRPCFKKNEIVDYLLESHPNCDLNQLAKMPFDNDDRVQFAQLIGYPIGGFAELGYVSDWDYKKAALMAKGHTEQCAETVVLREEVNELRRSRDALAASIAKVLQVTEEELKTFIVDRIEHF